MLEASVVVVALLEPSKFKSNLVFCAVGSVIVPALIALCLPSLPSLSNP